MNGDCDQFLNIIKMSIFLYLKPMQFTKAIFLNKHIAFIERSFLRRDEFVALLSPFKKKKNKNENK